MPVALAVDPAGNIYVAGTTNSSNFPTSGSISCVGSSSVPFQQKCSMQSAASGLGGFISKLSPDGHSLLYSVRLGGMEPNALTVDDQGEAFVGAGSGPAPGLFLIRVNASGTGLIYGTFLGEGGETALIDALAVDSQANCYVVGWATGNIPTTANALQVSNSNANLTSNPGNGFILEVNPTGSQLVYGTWFGPEYSATTITSIAINSDGSLYFAGATNATSLQATPGAYLSTPSGGFVAKLTPGSTALSAFSYLPFPSCSGCVATMTISNQAGTASLLLGYGAQGGEVLELSLPALGGASPTPSYTVPGYNNPGGFLTSGIALASPSSIWVVGACNSCALGHLISSNAFQSAPSSTGFNAVIIQLTDRSPTISLIGSSATGTAPFAPNQLISIYGTQLGPPGGASGQIGPDGAVTTSSGGTQVLFDGVAAPILYAGATQVNTAIPCSAAGKFSMQVVVT